jgi:Flp pilus assembly protein TadD
VEDRRKRIDEFRLLTDERFVEFQASEQILRAQEAAAKYELDAARVAIARAIELQPHNSLACNNLAWLLATGPLPLRDASNAMTLARRAADDTKIDDQEKSLYLNTLGVALFRAGKIDEAVQTLTKSLAMQPTDAQPFDLYFLCMCYVRLGQEKTARDYFNRAESLVNEHRSAMPQAWRTELAQFADESTYLLNSLPPHDSED